MSTDAKILQEQRESIKTQFLREVHHENHMLSKEGMKIPVLYAVVGGAGTGVSTLEKKLYDEGKLPEHAAIHDPDKVINMITEFAHLKNTNPRKAFEKWEIPARDLANEIADEAVENRQDLVYIRSLTFTDSINFIKNTKAAKYEISMCGVFADESVIKERLEKREEETGLHIDLDDALNRGRITARNMLEALKSPELVDEIEIYDNSAEGLEPVLIASRGPKDKEPAIYDKVAFERLKSIATKAITKSEHGDISVLGQDKTL